MDDLAANIKAGKMDFDVVIASLKVPCVSSVPGPDPWPTRSDA
jgi:ribosomal protein L1